MAIKPDMIGIVVKDMAAALKFYRMFGLDIAHIYDAPGEYTVVVKVIDFLGNDTNKTLKVTIP